MRTFAVNMSICIFCTMNVAAMAAGDINVELNNGDLKITGRNNTDQAFAISPTQNDGELEFQSLDQDTTFNGQAELTISGFFGDLVIDLKSGNKLLVLTEGDQDYFFVEGKLDIKSKGNFPVVLLLDSLWVEGQTKISTRNGDDAIINNTSVYRRRVQVSTGNGNDGLFFGFENLFTNRLAIKTGGGNDYVMLLDAFLGGYADIRTQGQDDTIGIYDSEIGEVSINGNGGVDALEIDNSDIVFVNERSIEVDFAGGIVAMFASARQAIATFDDAVVLYSFFNLND